MARAKVTKATKSAAPRLLAGGNPQIPRGEGDGPVRAFIAAMPGWKRQVGRRLDAVIARVFPLGVRKAVKWNSPLYGVKGGCGWFLGYHCCTNYVKVAFFRGASLQPPPPVASKVGEVRYLHIYEGQMDEVEPQFAEWVKQASQLPGEIM